MPCSGSSALHAVNPNLKNHTCEEGGAHLRISVWHLLMNFCHFAPFFALNLPNNPENQNWEKMKKEFGDVIILHICIKDHHYKMYASSDMECNRHNFLSFWAISCPFTSLLTPKIKNWKKCEMQKMPGDLTFHICVPWMKMIWCMVPGMLGAMELFIILDHFSPMTLLTTQNVKILKKWKNCLDILSFYTSVS